MRFASAPRAACSLTCRFHRGRRSAHQIRLGSSRGDAALCAALLHLHARVKQTQDVRLFLFLLLSPFPSFSSSIFLFVIFSLDFYLLVSPTISLNSFCPLRRRGQLHEAVTRGDVHAVRALQAALHYTTRRDDDDDDGDDGHVDHDDDGDGGAAGAH